jgi:hypothetical protein
MGGSYLQGPQMSIAAEPIHTWHTTLCLEERKKMRGFSQERSFQGIDKQCSLRHPLYRDTTIGRPQ